MFLSMAVLIINDLVFGIIPPSLSSEHPSTTTDSYKPIVKHTRRFDDFFYNYVRSVAIGLLAFFFAMMCMWYVKIFYSRDEENGGSVEEIGRVSERVHSQRHLRRLSDREANASLFQDR